MKVLGLAAALAAASLVPVSASAQHVSVSAVIVIGNRGPAYGPVYRDSRSSYHDYRPVRRVYVEQRYPRAIRVRRIHQHYDHRSNCREVQAYYDHGRNAYYDDYHPGLQSVALYERGHEYYRYDD